jgi:alpha-D-xyloside xylohydrolase
VSPVWEKGKRTREVYLPAGSRWRDAWRPSKVYRGGQAITVTAEPHQLPLFIRVGSNVQVGDLNKEWQESVEIANRKPDLKALDAELKAWWDARKTAGERR